MLATIRFVFLPPLWNMKINTIEVKLSTTSYKIWDLVKHRGSFNFLLSMGEKSGLSLEWCRKVYPNFPDWVDNEISNNKNKHSLRSNTKCYGGKTHYTYSQNSDTTALSGRDLYHLEFSLQAASPETFGYTVLHRLRVFRNPVLRRIFGAKRKNQGGWGGRLM
jgi:hypothetical protein